MFALSYAILFTPCNYYTNFFRAAHSVTQWPSDNVTGLTEFVLLGILNYPSRHIFVFLLYCIIYSMTIVVNFSVIILIWHDSHLHKPMYFFLANLALLEILYTTTITPNSLKGFFQEDRTISFIGCFIQIYFFVALAGTECILLSVMAYDRYIAICHPLQYPIKMNPSHCVRLAVLSWSIGFLNSLLQTVHLASLPYCNDNRVNNFFCDIPPLLKLSCAHNKNLEIVVLLIGEYILLGDLILTITSYIFIIRTVIRTPRRSRSYKMFSTCGSHLAVVTLFFGTLLIPFIHPSSPSSAQDKVLAVIYGVITPLINPFIYCIRNTDFQKAIEKSILQRQTGTVFLGSV